MASSHDPPAARLDFRVKPEHKSLIERRRPSKGSVTDFAVAILVKAAHETIERAALRTLSARDSKVFLQMLRSTAAPNAALKAAAKRYKTRAKRSRALAISAGSRRTQGR